MSDTICFVSLISKENSPLYIQSFTYDPVDQVDDEQEQEPKPIKNEEGQQEVVGNPTQSPLKLPPSTTETNKFLKYNFLSHMSLDIFESPFIESLTQDNNNLLFIQDGISVYGFETNTGLKVVIGTDSKENISEKLLIVFQSIYKMYLKIICNPFYQPKDPNEPLNNERFDSEIKILIDEFNSQ